MRRGIPVLIVVGLTLAASAGPARAQPPLAGGPGAAGDSASPLLIAMAPAVQEELKLNADQKNKVYELVTSMSQRQRELNQSVFFGGGQLTPQAVFQARDNLRREIERSLGQIFDKKQNERFLQVVLRAEGPLAIARPEIASRLGLNGAKTQQVQGVAIRLQQARRQLFMSMRMNGVAAGGEGFNRQAVGKFAAASNDLRKEAIQQIARLLTKDQRDAFDKMLGEPFDLSKLPSSDPGTPAREAAKAEPAQEKGRDAAAATTLSDDDPRPDEKAKSPAKKKRKGR
jgi:hypothetical protein